MESLESIQTLVQAGAVGISIALIILIFFIIKIFMKHLNNHSQHQTDAMTESIKVTGQLNGAVRELSIYVRALNGKK